MQNQDITTISAAHKNPATAEGDPRHADASRVARSSVFARGAGLAYAGLAYLGFFAAYLAFVLRNMGLLDGTALDLGPRFDSSFAALAFDVSLVLGFGLQHSVMARAGFKRRWTRLVPSVLERSTYVWASNAATFAIAFFWADVGGQVWDVSAGAFGSVLWVIGVVGWVLVALASFLIDHFELFGLRQVWSWAFGSRPRDITFRTPGAYRWVRHPMMFGMLLGLWGAPVMALPRLTLALGMTAYILVGVYFEERDLITRFGQSYRDYQKRVSMLLPLRAPRDSRRSEDRASTEVSCAEV